MSFADENSSSGTYTLVCKNNSTTAWVLYMYQKKTNQPKDVFSIVWFACPLKIAPGKKITYTWSIDFSFVWGNSGKLSPGVFFSEDGAEACSLKGNNQTTFSLDNRHPQLSSAFPGGQEGSLTIYQASNVVKNQFSTGIGMSGQGTFVQQALANSPQIYTPKSKYFIAAGPAGTHMGQVLAQTVKQTKEVVFPANIFTMYATLQGDNSWDVTKKPPK